ncbi:MAG: hypothetical protein QXO84_00395 [Candidatus Aenigmatarchaeota archaeon]
MIQIVLGLLLILLGVFLASKIVGNLIKLFLLLIIFFLGFYLIFGYIPYSSTIFDLKNIFGISILSIGKDVEGKMLLAVKNNWFFEAKNLSVSINGNETGILNNVKSIKGRKIEILQVDWREDFNKIIISSSVGKTEYLKK